MPTAGSSSSSGGTDAVGSSGNDLLDAIRNKRLRKVEKDETERTQSFNMGTNVAAILARRMALEMSDSESGTESEWSDDDEDDDDDEWDD